MADNASIKPARSRFGISLPLLFGLVFYVQALRAVDHVLGDPDTYWHIVIGRWIIAHGAIPHHDLFSLTKPGAPFTPPEWLAEVALAWLHDHFGWVGLVVLTALMVGVALAMLLHRLLRDLAPIHAMIATALAWDFTQYSLLARPHILTLPILVAWVSGLAGARTQNRAPSLGLVPLMTLWANLHGSYMMGLALAAALAGEAVLAGPDRLRAARGWALFGVMSLAAAVITPTGVEGLMYPIRLMRMPFLLAQIQEWQSPNFQVLQPLELWLVVVLLAALTAGWRLPLTRVAIVLVLVHMALQHARLGLFLGYAAPILLAPAVGPQFKERSGGRLVSWIDRAIAELAKPPRAWGVGIAGAMLAALTAAFLPPHIEHEADYITPKAALAAVTAHHVAGPVLNDYQFGGYLAFRGIRPFIDGRADFYGDKFLKSYYRAVTLDDGGLPELLDRYHIAWTLFAPDRPAVVLLDHLTGWRRIYAGPIAVVHVRDTRLKLPARAAKPAAVAAPVTAR